MNAKTLLRADKLPPDFYLQKNVCKLAKSLIGKVLVSHFDGLLTAARIVETEAYNGITDKASHAWNGRRTHRTETMYAKGGIAYVYLCYGIHHLFNVVTNEAEIPHAVLVRGAVPLLGMDTMLQRVGKPRLDDSLTRGPGNLSKAMGISLRHNACSLQENELYIVDDGMRTTPSQVLATPRIGVDYAAEDALLPYRFILKDNPFVSGKK